MKVGLIGWKLFSSAFEDNTQLFDIPYFIVEAVKNIVLEDGRGSVRNACDLMIEGAKGVRVTNNANEIAHFEFGACTASKCILELFHKIRLGQREMDLAEVLSSYGQKTTIQTICASGKRFINAVVAPREKEIAVGETFSASLGYDGGMTCRKGYVAATEADLPENDKNYIEEVAKPYFATIVNWYENMQIGKTCGDLYDIVEASAPKAQYGNVSRDVEIICSMSLGSICQKRCFHFPIQKAG